MKLTKRIYISLTKFFPKSYVKYFESMMRYAGEHENVLLYLGSSLLLSFLVFIIALLYVYYYTPASVFIALLVAIMAFFFIQVVFYLAIYFKVESRIEQVESCLPDQLQLMANNIKSGMTPFHALTLSARKEFGALSEEILNATKQAWGVNSFTEALIDISRRIKSVMLERVLKLEASSLKTGGNLSSLLSDLANDIRETQALRKDLISKTRTYTAFILFTVLFGTPVLLSISVHFVEMLSSFTAMGGNIPDASGFDIGFIAGGSQISPVFLTNFSYVMLAITTLFASMLMGVITKGKATSGIRYYPPLQIAVLVIFIGARSAIGSILG
ncbi:MAG: type II secretion system F family protein [Candidatus Woesearchaeota archaeon]